MRGVRAKGEDRGKGDEFQYVYHMRPHLPTSSVVDTPCVLLYSLQE